MEKDIIKTNTIYQIQNEIKPCIYFLLSKERVVYVGKSIGDVLGRIHDHYKNKTFDSFYFITCEEVELDDLEFFYIKKHSPKYNKDLNRKYKKPGYITRYEVSVFYRERYGFGGFPKKEFLENVKPVVVTKSGTRYFRKSEVKAFFDVVIG